MTDNLNVEGSGAGGSPSQPVSQPAIEGAADLSKLLDEKLDKMLKPVLGELRGLQSRQDKSDKAYREFLDEYEKAKASGKNNADAEAHATQVIDERKRQSQREAMFDEMAKRLGLVPDQSVGNGAGGAVNVAEVVADFGLDPQAPDVIANVMNRSYASEEEALKAAREYKRKKAGAPQPSDADRPVTPARPVGTATPEAIKSNYLKEVAEAMKNSDHRVRSGLIKGIQEKYRSNGFDPAYVDLTKEFKF